ncbi:squalene synthase HpnC [Planosporangium sp. 12N6]|uniref:squalene synthase HpnC n=1 Tax=Planosporangium spinosum TaxID=3402278 RepID=UPI003CF2E54A
MSHGPADGPVPARPPVPPRADENFPVALRVLPAATRRHLLALYGYARHVDDLGDEPPPSASGTDVIAALDRFEHELWAVYAGAPARHPVIAALAPTIAACRLPVDPLVRLVEANRVDQIVSRYPTFDQLVAYCRLSANPVGELVLHVFGCATPERLELSDRICTALQVVEHLQDVAEDLHRGRIYLPKEDLDRFGVPESDLGGATASPRLRELLAFESQRARAWLDAGAPLVSTLRGFARLAVSGYVAGGRAALRALDRAGYDPLPGPPKAGRRDVLVQLLAATVRGPG